MGEIDWWPAAGVGCKQTDDWLLGVVLTINGSDWSAGFISKSDWLLAVGCRICPNVGEQTASKSVG